LEITLGPDGNLWFTESAGRIGVINPTTHAVAEFQIPTAGSDPTFITTGPDGNLWFSEAQKSQIGRINPTTHTITEFPIPTANSRPEGIASGPDGNLWFTEQLGNKIGQLVPARSSTAPDLALSGQALISVTLGSNVTYSLTVTNGGSAPAAGVTLTDSLPADVVFVSATGGVTPSNGVLSFNIGSLDGGAGVSFTIVVAPKAAGTLQNQATVSMTQTDPTPADNSVIQTTTVTPPVVTDGPTVNSVAPIVSHGRIKSLLLTFDKPLDPVRAQSRGNYLIAALGGPKRAIRIKAALYNAATETVTLRPARRLDSRKRFRLTVVGAGSIGVADIFGNLLDGERTGHPGSNFVAIVS
jgi:uncharacterized repeat protein (TIGR01451 family)